MRLKFNKTLKIVNLLLKHNIDSHRELSVGLPYIYLSPDFNKRMTAEDGICLILSDGDSRLLARYEKEKPFDTNVSQVFCLYSNQTKFGFTRFICFARLHSHNPVLQCCRKTSPVIWLNPQKFPDDFTDIIGHYIQWKIFYKDFEKMINKIRVVQGTYEMLPQFISENFMTPLPKRVEKQVELLFIDFIEHCFPSKSMSFYSFKTYLKKYGFIWAEKYLRRVFYGFGQSLEDSDEMALLGDDLLFGLAFFCQCQDDSPLDDSQLEFVFRFYDFDRDGYLSEEEFREMVRDIDSNQSEEVIERVVSDNLLLNESEKGMTFEEFLLRVEEGWLEGTDGLCRLNASDCVIRKIEWVLANKSSFKKRLTLYFRRLLNE